MAARRQSAADRRRRTHGQNLLTDPTVVDRLLSRLELTADELVVEVGPGRGALTLPLARAGVRVLAIERDGKLLGELQRRIEDEGLGGRVQLRRGDLRDAPWPRQPYRVVANPPFGLTTTLLGRLLDDPETGPTRADLLLQWDVVRKHTTSPPASLRTAAWAPWWHFERGEKVPREKFRPVPKVDAGWLIVQRRDPPLLPVTLAPGFAELLRPAWQEATSTPPGRRPGPRRGR
ncbi:methyltransferase domain-containing protein [Nitriliruptoraceae bacterium ZYF776]|nr:methyltransferase domain-containing protein [Profundirhabdus halotolerans]